MKNQQLLYKYPPDFQKANQHRLANRIFKGVQKNPNCESCQCCDRKIGVQDPNINCCYDRNQLAYLGPGIPLLFAYIRNSILMLLLFTLIFAGFCLYSNISSDYCDYDSVNCDYNIFNTISFANKINKTDLLSIQNYILISFVVLNIVLFQFYRYNFRQIQEECDEIVNSPSDYAIVLRRLPENITKQDLQRMVQQRRSQLTEQQKNKTQNLKVDHIILSYALGQYTRTNSLNQQNFKKAIQQNKITQFKPQQLPKFTQTATLAIIVFSRQQSKQFFLYKPSIGQKMITFVCSSCTPLSNFKVKNQRVSIQRAPQPDDIIWQNCKISIKGSIIRKCIFNTISIIILLIGGGAQYGLAVLQNSFTDALTKQLFSIGLSLVVTGFNYIILQFIVFFSQKQRNQTQTQLNEVLTVKISFFQFLNTGVFVVLANFLADIQNFSITQELPTDVTIVMIANAITPNLTLWFLCYFQISQKFFRYLVKWQFTKANQIQTNKLWEGPKAQIPYKYAYVLKTLWLTAFYAPLVPVVVPISAIGLILNYFLQKYLYGFVYSVPNMLSSMVNDSAIQLMQYFPLIMSLGEFIVYMYMQKFDPTILPISWSIPIYISIALSGLNLILPMDQINKYFKLPSDSSITPPYDKISEKFQVTYEMTNPAYECKKKRKRDVFLINQVFGGQGKNIANNLTNIFGLNPLNQTQRSMIKDPLLNKTVQTSKNANNPNLLNNLITNNDTINKSQQKNTTMMNTTMNTSAMDLNTSKKQDENNPFAAFMKLNNLSPGQNNNSNPNQVSNITNQNKILNNNNPSNMNNNPNPLNSTNNNPSSLNTNNPNSTQANNSLPSNQNPNANNIPNNNNQQQQIKADNSSGKVNVNDTNPMNNQINNSNSHQVTNNNNHQGIGNNQNDQQGTNNQNVQQGTTGNNNTQGNNSNNIEGTTINIQGNKNQSNQPHKPQQTIQMVNLKNPNTTTTNPNTNTNTNNITTNNNNNNNANSSLNLNFTNNSNNNPNPNNNTNPSNNPNNNNINNINNPNIANINNIIKSNNSNSQNPQIQTQQTQNQTNQMNNKNSLIDNNYPKTNESNQNRITGQDKNHAGNSQHVENNNPSNTAPKTEPTNQTPPHPTNPSTSDTKKNPQNITSEHFIEVEQQEQQQPNNNNKIQSTNNNNNPKIKKMKKVKKIIQNPNFNQKNIIQNQKQTNPKINLISSAIQKKNSNQDKLTYNIRLKNLISQLRRDIQYNPNNGITQQQATLKNMQDKLAKPTDKKNSKNKQQKAVKSPTSKNKNMTSSKNKDNISVQQAVFFLNTFPNLQKQRQTSRNLMQIYSDEKNIKQINHYKMNKKQTSTVLYQESQELSYTRTFPHIQIHVPKPKYIPTLQEQRQILSKYAKPVQKVQKNIIDQSGPTQQQKLGMLAGDYKPTINKKDLDQAFQGI